MADYQQMYRKMFNAATDAIEAIRERKDDVALSKLIVAQQECEEVFIETDPDISLQPKPNVVEIPIPKDKK